jgi:CheY-like chemotaxis protein
MNGWDFLDHIQDKVYAQRLKVAVVSSSINESDRRKAFSYPQVIEFIQKPFRREDCLNLMALPQLASYYSKNN